MKIRLFVYAALLTGILVPASRLAAQGDTLRFRKNIAEVFYGFNYSMNGITPKAETNYHLGGGWGVDYIRFLGKRNIGIELSYHSWRWGRSTESPSSPDQQIFLWRTTSRYLSARAHLPILNKQKVKWYCAGGFAYRTGYDDLMYNPIVPGWDVIINSIPQRDIGMSIGSRFSWYAHSRIVLSADIRYTRFLFIYSTSSDFLASYKGPPKNHLCLQAKVGFCF